jgi:hypothetical protein
VAVTSITSNQIFQSGFTYSIWIKPDTFGGGGYARIIDKIEGGTETFFMIDGNTAPANKVGVQIAGGTTIYSSGSSINLGVWQHVVATVAKVGNNAYVTFYINGIQSGTPGLSGVLANIGNTNPLTIGHRANAGNDRTFDGLIDDVKVYNYVLTPWQVAQEYNGGKPIGYWKMDESQGSTVYDSSGKGNTGNLSLNGSPATSSAWQTSSNCKLNSCLDFDGTNDYVSIGSSLPTMTEGSLGIWVYREGTTGTYQMMFTDNSSQLEMCWYGTDTLRFYVDNALISYTASLLNSWHYLVGTFSQIGNFKKLYIDGTLVASGSYTGDATAASRWLGSRQGSLPFVGKLDEVKVYNYARSPAQVREDYNMGKGIFFK